MALDPMAEIRASFFVECEELLESLQDALATMAMENMITRRSMSSFARFIRSRAELAPLASTIWWPSHIAMKQCWTSCALGGWRSRPNG